MEQASKDTEPTREVALEANQLHGKKMAPERIGRVLMTAEEPAITKDREKSTEQAALDKRVDTMSRSELLDLSEKVAVENTTLRRIYETHLVGEQGLRRLVNEHMRGGDIQKVLRQELVEHEIDFERDPLLRNRTRPVVDSASNDSLTSLLQKANVSTEAETKEELAVLKARQSHHETLQRTQQTRRRVIDVSMVVAITVLFVLVVMLLRSR